MPELQNIINLVFHLFMFFIVTYSGFAIFSLIRYGKSQILGFVVSAVYIALLSGLYFQALSIIKSL